VRVECRGEGGSFLDDPDTGMTVPVDVAFVGFGQAKPTFQGEIILGDVSLQTDDEESWLEAGHYLGQLLVHRFRR
jgi:hypothetical protein